MMRSIDEHLAAVLALAPAPVAESVAVQDAIGRTLAADARAAVDVPAFANSAMDGFAVRHADVATASEATPVNLTVTHDLPAGSAADPPVAPGTAVRIMTGAPVPTEADAIVPFESTRGGLADSLDTITVLAAPGQGVHVRRAGDDVRAGATILRSGTRIGPLQAAAIAAVGVGTVTVARRPRVAVIATGAELRPPGTPLERGEIPESNSTLLAGLAAAAGAEVVLVTSVDDEPAAFRAVLDSASEADVIVTSGGVSAGAFEVVRETLAGTIDFVQVRMQPGKPQAIGRLADGRVLLGLPGNPVSAAVSHEVFVRPLLLAMQGTAPAPPARLEVATGWRRRADRTQIMPVTIDRTDAWRIRPASIGGSGSHLTASLALADGFAVVPIGEGSVETGDVLDVLLLPRA